MTSAEHCKKDGRQAVPKCHWTPEIIVKNMKMDVNV
jgi:hypothetical protein